MRFLQVLAFYTKRRAIAMALLGFSSGLPLLLTASTLTLRLSGAGISIKTIGLFSLVGIPYSLKFLWSPLLDALDGRRILFFLGRRSSALVVVQLALAGAIFGMGFVAARDIETLAWWAFLVSFLSATQDCLIDALRVEIFPEEEQSQALSSAIFFYRVGMFVAGTGAMGFAVFLSSRGLSHHVSWMFSYGLMSALMVIGVFGTFLMGESRTLLGRAKEMFAKNFLARFEESVKGPFQAIFRMRGWISLFIFVILYKIGDVFTGHMLIPFFLHRGLPKSDYVIVSAITGFPLVALGSFVGAWIDRVVGLKRAIIFGILFQNLSNLSFFVLNYVHVGAWSAGVALGIEGFSGAIGSIVFVAFLSLLCRDRRFTATQYALFAALASVGRVFLAAPSGYLAAYVGYGAFFVSTFFIGLPSLFFFLYFAKKNQSWLRR